MFDALKHALRRQSALRAFDDGDIEFAMHLLITQVIAQAFDSLLQFGAAFCAKRAQEPVNLFKVAVGERHRLAFSH